jgi:hypothetical protein
MGRDAMSNELDRTAVETAAGTYTIIEHWEEDGGRLDPLTDYDHEGMDLYLFRRNSGGWEINHDDLTDSKPTVSIDYDHDGEITLQGDVDAAAALLHFIDTAGGWGNPEPVERRMNKWLALAGHSHTFVSSSVHAPYQDATYYFALVDNNSDYTEPAEAIRSTMTEWAAWANGEVYYFRVEGPDGEDIESCGGYIGTDGRECMMHEARDVVEHDADRRTESAALAGAGFTGII